MKEYAMGICDRRLVTTRNRGWCPVTMVFKYLTPAKETRDQPRDASHGYGTLATGQPRLCDNIHGYLKKTTVTVQDVSHG